MARATTGDYMLAFLTAGALAITAALLSLRIGRAPDTAHSKVVGAQS